jgi:multiple sugar transport system substrate-binding protein
MVELALSLNWSLPDALAEALNSFEQRYGIGVRPRVLDHAQEKQQISGFAISGSGPDVSEVGTTWLSDLISMCALRDFSPWEITSLEREGAFFQPAWEPGVEFGTALAVPWRTDTRVIYYRRDLPAAVLAKLRPIAGRLDRSFARAH